MEQTDDETLKFFEGHESALPIYEKLESVLFAQDPDTKKTVKKTQINFADRYIYACVSFARVKRKAELPDPYLVLTLGLPYPLESGRVAVKSEPYPGRWTTHIVLGRPEDIDAELLDWIRQACVFSQIK